MHELDELLQHHGVKGMKWGVRKKIETTINNRRTKNVERKTRIANAYHEKNKHKKSYQRAYNRNLKKYERRYKNKPGRDAELVAKLTTRQQIRSAKISRAQAGLVLAAHWTAADVTMGRNYSGRLVKKVTSPENIRRGKNIVQAIKRSNIRYVDGKTMTNVINVGAKLLK